MTRTKRYDPDVSVKRPRKRCKPIACPQTSPLVMVLCMVPGQMRLKYCDSVRPDRAGKPFGAKGLHLFVAIGDRELGPDEARFYRMYTRSPFNVEFEPEDDGKVATFYARWVSARGETGPWSMPESMRIAA